MNTDRLVAAWRRWDRLPKDHYSANLLEDHVQETATEMGISGSELRRRVVALREQGQTARDAITAVCG